jgi:transcription factor WhiB
MGQTDVRHDEPRTVPPTTADEALILWLMTPEAPAGFLELFAPPAWYSQAACRHVGPATFFPEGRASAEALALCAECPVRAECAEAGMGERHGVWGGMTLRERRRAERRGALRACHNE